MATPSKKDAFIAHFMKSPVADFNSYQQELREEAYQALTQLDFPTLRDEAWKYTRVAQLLKGTYDTQEVQWEQIPEAWLLEGTYNRLVFVNGFYQPHLSELPDAEQIDILTLAQARIEHFDVIEKHYAQQADHKNEIFTALNTAFNRTGVFIRVPANAQLQHPIHILDVSEGNGVTYQPRNLIVAESGSEATVLLSQESGEAGEVFSNAITEIVVEEQARLQYYTVQNMNDSHTHIHTVQVNQASNSWFQSGTFTFGGKLVRNNLNIDVNGTNCETNLYGTYVLHGKQHVDNHTRVDHRQPHCLSNENYKGILSGTSTGVFNGKVFVRQDAQKINAFQSNRNILLTDGASINSKPELEIYADDVKCSHGSTTGQLDRDAFFYLTSRGVHPTEAKKLLVHAFVSEVIDHISEVPFRQRVTDLLNEQSLLL